jgi:hypothetical protein
MNMPNCHAAHRRQFRLVRKAENVTGALIYTEKKWHDNEMQRSNGSAFVYTSDKLPGATE